MTDVEFRSWPKTKRYENLNCYITEKLDGTNGIIHLSESGGIMAGSRNRWLSTDGGRNSDNFGFARWVEDNKEELQAALTPGYHYGEWVGAGINRGYNLKDKQFFLFCPWRYDLELWAKMYIDTVPLLKDCTFAEVPFVIEELRSEMFSGATPTGSKIDRDTVPEGLIVQIPDLGAKFKVIWDK